MATCEGQRRARTDGTHHATPPSRPASHFHTPTPSHNPTPAPSHPHFPPHARTPPTHHPSPHLHESRRLGQCRHGREVRRHGCRAGGVHAQRVVVETARVAGGAARQHAAGALLRGGQRAEGGRRGWERVDGLVWRRRAEGGEGRGGERFKSGGRGAGYMSTVEAAPAASRVGPGAWRVWLPCGCRLRAHLQPTQVWRAQAGALRQHRHRLITSDDSLCASKQGKRAPCAGRMQGLRAQAAVRACLPCGAGKEALAKGRCTIPPRPSTGHTVAKSVARILLQGMGWCDGRRTSPNVPSCSPGAKRSGPAGVNGATGQPCAG
jgi:hypothetical protein